MNGPSPLVAVCIPVYNARPYLAATIESVLRQTYENWTLTVVENRSTDGSRELLEELARKADDPRIRLHFNEEHLDMPSNLNRALELAEGDFVKLLCADDGLAFECLDRQVAALQEHPGAVIAGCSRTITGPNGETLFVRSSFPRAGIYPGRAVIKRCLWAGTNLIGEPSSVLIRSSILKTMPHLDAGTRYWIDFDLWTRMLLRGDLYFDTEPLAQFRIHGRAATRTFERAMLHDFIDLADRRLREMGDKLKVAQRLWLHGKVRLLNFARRLVYRRFGGVKGVHA